MEGVDRVEVERTALPGIGLRHVFGTARGRRVGVVSHRGGRRDLVVYDREDPDTARETVVLTQEEANALAELLGTARIVERLAELERQVEGLTSAQIPVGPGSPYDGRTLGGTRARTRTGASIVAVGPRPAGGSQPTPGVRLPGGDIVVAVGSAEATAAVADLLANG